MISPNSLFSLVRTSPSRCACFEAGPLRCPFLEILKSQSGEFFEFYVSKIWCKFLCISLNLYDSMMQLVVTMWQVDLLLFRVFLLVSFVSFLPSMLARWDATLQVCADMMELLRRWGDSSEDLGTELMICHVSLMFLRFFFSEKNNSGTFALLSVEDFDSDRVISGWASLMNMPVDGLRPFIQKLLQSLQLSF